MIAWSLGRALCHERITVSGLVYNSYDLTSSVKTTRIGDAGDGPLVSIIVPTKNSEASIVACLESAKWQHHTNIEIIVVDCYSTDKTRFLAEASARVYLWNGERSEARNLGARLAQGPYILFIDSDMLLPPELVTECLQNIREGIAAIIIPEIAKAEGFWGMCRKLEKDSYEGNDLFEAPRFFNTNAFRLLGGYDDSLPAGGEDWDLHSRFLKSRFQMARVNCPITHVEGRLSLKRCVTKKLYYGSNMSVYMRRYPIRGAIQLFPIRSSFLRNRKLTRQPRLFFGLLIMKVCEAIAGVLGLVRSEVMGPGGSDQ